MYGIKGSKTDWTQFFFSTGLGTTRLESQKRDCMEKSGQFCSKRENFA